MDEAKNLSDAKGEGSPCTPSQVEAIFFAALNEKTAAARADYLARACGDNAKLRSRVERLLEPIPRRWISWPSPQWSGRQVERPDSVEDDGRPSRDHRPLPGHPAARPGRVRAGLPGPGRRARPPRGDQGAQPRAGRRSRGRRGLPGRGPRPRQARPPQHRPGLRRGPDRRRPLLRGLQVHRGQRPGGAAEAGPAVVPGVGRAGGGRSPRRCTTPTPGAWSTATSSRPIS